MQVFRLVEGGVTDRIIAFDSLPDRLLSGIEKIDVALYKLPRHWTAFAGVHYILDYKMINADKERWENIKSFVRSVVPPEAKLLDQIENMAVKMAPTPKAPLAIEPEDVPVIQIPVEFQEKKTAVPVTESVAETSAAGTVKLKHSCDGRGRFGRLAKVGACLRCDQMRAEELQTVGG